MFFAKQHQDKQQLKNLISLFYRNLECLLTTFDINAIALTPPSISRKVQILDLVDQLLDPSIPRIPLIKYSPSKILIPQKSLKDLRTEYKMLKILFSSERKILTTIPFF